MILVGMDEQNWEKDMVDEDSLLRARCLVHVAATRARCELLVTATPALAEIMIPIPPQDSDIMHAYDALTRPLYRRIDACLKENKELAAQRDFLLPRLMTGEITVTE